MIVLGLLLVAAAAAFGVELFLSNNSTETVGEAFGQSITQLSAGGYFLLGSATTVALFFGVLLIDSGLRRGRRSRAKREEAEARQAEATRQAEWEKSEAVSEAERLREELVDERMNSATLGGVVMPPDLEAPGEVTSGPAEPVDDPEHARKDHRGLLGRIRGDRPELAGDDVDDVDDVDPTTTPEHQPMGASVRPNAAAEAFNSAVTPTSERERPVS